MKDDSVYQHDAHIGIRNMIKYLNRLAFYDEPDYEELKVLSSNL